MPICRTDASEERPRRFALLTHALDERPATPEARVWDERSGELLAEARLVRSAWLVTAAGGFRLEVESRGAVWVSRAIREGEVRA